MFKILRTRSVSFLNQKVLSKRVYSQRAADTLTDKAYKPFLVEKKWYNLWQNKLNEFNRDSNRKIFSMLFPPPNVTGNLHLGHALTATIQDVLVRWKLMKKFRVVWVPGYDHAGIATQVVVEKKLWTDRKLTRHDLGREAFIEEVFKWKNKKQEVIRSQLIDMNALLDWNYEYFSMNKTIRQSVNEAFIDLHKRNLVYRAIKPVNWCCSLKSAISDAEVDNRLLTKRTYLSLPGYEKPVEFGMIYTYDYPIQNSDFFITVSTTRPETIFGDTAIAVHPTDPKYKHLHGKKCINPMTNELLEIIPDKSVNLNFGTGAVKVTPAHDYTDYEIGQRHNLLARTIMDESGHLINVPDEFKGMPRFLARHKVLDRLKSVNLLRGSSSHQMTLPLCSRTGDVIEPAVREQWFARSAELFQVCQTAVEKNELEIIPKMRINLWSNYSKSFTTKDWCISRQLWWGQQIPAYKCMLIGAKHDTDGVKWISAQNEDEARREAVEHFSFLQRATVTENQISVEQDQDVFDTWFTSTLLPIAIIGWPFKEQPTLYPTSILETGYDIMFFWAFRMVGLCHALTGKIPFKKLLFHGLIRDSQGRKMSKSIGNVIDPNDLISGVSADELQNRVNNSNLSEAEKKLSSKNQEKLYPTGIEAVGSDALRLALMVQDFKTENINIDMPQFTDAKRYCNKIWNGVNYCQAFHAKTATPFRVMSVNQIVESKSRRFVDVWLLSKLSETVKEVNKNFADEYDLHRNVKALRRFYYTYFFDFYVESTKPLFRAINQSDKHALAEVVWNCMRICNRTMLLMYHPFIPSITEELWQINKGFTLDFDVNSLSILEDNYPSDNDFELGNNIDLVAVNEVVNVSKSIVTNVNSLKLLAKSPSQSHQSGIEKVSIDCHNNSCLRDGLASFKEEIRHLTKAEEINFSERFVHETEKADQSRELCDESKKNSVLCKISNECAIRVHFKIPIDTALALDKLKRDAQKIEKKITGLKSLIANTKYEKDTDQCPIKKYQKKIDECQDDLSAIRGQILMFEN